MAAPQTTNIQEQGQVPHAAPATQVGEQLPFKDRVIGVAKKTRGTLLAKPELKEHGEKILQGEATINDINEPRTS
ncbi:hypothetical protein C8R43DRAFT_1014434 [Mycena crocata]|nr:hypothetical protein C8R43DRAFT_1014434 [Mycena crocata]